jgi:bisanhydrobacterioruberin hydratase
MIGSLSKTQMGIAYLGIIYMVGIVGILLPIHPEFIRLTPLNLIVSLATVLYFHPSWSRNTFIALGICFSGGFLAEVFGVQTGLLFGEYYYEDVLGFKLWETPLMIGVNWMLLAYCCGVSVNMLLPKAKWPTKGFLAAILMVLLDLLLEPVAIQYNFWEWPAQQVPLQNYLGWFIVAWPLLSIFVALQGQIRNKVAVALLVMQFVFFAILVIWNQI